MEGVFKIDKAMSNEENLVKIAIKGDKEAFKKLIEIYSSYIYKTAYLYVKNEHDACDIYQETVYKAFINISKLKKTKNFKTWIIRILINNVTDKYRKDTKRQINLESNNIKNFNEEELIKNIDLYEAIDKLSLNYKTAIILKYIHDMKIKEVARIMEINENTAKSYIYRGLKILNSELREV